MPHKFNAARRHKFDKAQYRVINWAEYNESLRQRGDLTIWVSEGSAPRRTSRGGQRRYSDLAIETCLTLRTAYRLGLRQTQGLMGSIGTLMGLRVPDFSTLSRRANGLSIAQVMKQAGSVPVHLVVEELRPADFLSQCHPEQLFIELFEETFDTAVTLRFANKGGRGLDSEESNLVLKVLGSPGRVTTQESASEPEPASSDHRPIRHRP